MLHWEDTNEASLNRVSWRKYFLVRTIKKYYLGCQQWQEEEDCKASVVSYDFCISSEVQCLLDEANQDLGNRGKSLIILKGQYWGFNRGQPYFSYSLGSEYLTRV